MKVGDKVGIDWSVGNVSRGTIIGKTQHRWLVREHISGLEREYKRRNGHLATSNKTRPPRIVEMTEEVQRRIRASEVMDFASKFRFDLNAITADNAELLLNTLKEHAPSLVADYKDYF